MDIDLDNLSLKDLKDLRSRVDRAISSFEDRRKREAAEKLEAEARELGFSLRDLVDIGGGRKRAAATPKYANPHDPDDTWTGRGRKPRWFIEAVEAGRSPEDLAV